MSSKPASTGGGTTTQTVQNQIPQWVSQAGQDLYGQTQQAANSGSLDTTVQPMNQTSIDDLKALQNNVGSTTGLYQQAEQGTQGLTGYQNQQVTPGFLSGTDLSPYMNPYTQNVIDKTMPLIDQQRQAANNQSADLASKTGAFGGSRQGVQEALNNSQSGLYAGQLGAQLNQQNFTQAQAAATGDLNRSLAAQQSNQTAGLQGANLRLNANQQLGNLTGQGQDAYLKGLMASMGGQEQLRQNQENQANEGAVNQARRIQAQQSVLSTTPYSTTQTGTTTSSQTGSSNPWLTGLGAALSTAGTAAQVYSAFSDRTAKTDIRKIGTDEETDLPLYAYRYKGDPKTYPKVVGIMAQDAQKKYPEQVVRLGGKLAVRSSFLNGIMERATDG